MLQRGTGSWIVWAWLRSGILNLEKLYSYIVCGLYLRVHHFSNAYFNVYLFLLAFEAALRFLWVSCPSPDVMSGRGSERQALLINPLRSAHCWNHPSSNPPHIFGTKTNPWGSKKHVWSYSFPVLFCPSLSKQLYRLQGPHLRTSRFFEWSSYSKTASLNFA